MPGSNSPYTGLDFSQVIRQSFDEANDRLRVDAEVTAVLGDVDISAAESDIAIKDRNTGYLLTIESDGSINVNTIISHLSDSIKIGDGTNLASVTAANALKIDGSGVVQPISGTVTVNPLTNSSIVKAQLQDNNANGITSTANALDINIKSGSIANTTFASTQSGTWNINNISGTISLPNGAATSTKQPALGIAGTPSSDIITIQGITGMVALKIDGSGVIQPVSGTVTANQGGTWNINNISGTVSLPTGAATSSLQTTGNTSLNNIDTKTPALGQALAVASVPVVLTAAQLSTLTPLTTVTVTQGTGTNLHTVVDSGSITANAGTNLNTSALALETGGNLASVKTNTDNLSLSQGSTTSGQKGNLILSATTTSAPTYTTGQSNPLSTTTNGALRVDLGATSSNSTPIQVGGSDGSSIHAFSIDTLGRLKLAASTYFHPIFTLRVQSVIGNSPSLATSLVIPISLTSSGNLIAVMVSSSVAGTVTVTDNLSQSYSMAISGTSGTRTNYTFYKSNTLSGVTSITISSTSSSGLNAVVTEYSGISASPLDKTSTGTVTGTTAFSSGATAAITSSPELLLGSAHGTTKNNQTYTAGSGWTSIGTSNGFNAGAGQIYVEDQYVSLTGTYTATGTASGNDTIVSNIVTFVINNTNLMTVNQPKIIKSGSGILRKIIINTIGTGSPTLTLYDNTTNSGTIIGVLSISVVGAIDYNLNFINGLTVVANTTTGDFTLVYD